MLTIILGSFDTIVSIVTTSSSITLSLAGFRLIIIPMSSSIASRIPIGNKVKYEIVTQKQNKRKKQYQRDQQTNKALDKLYRERLQDNLFDKNSYESLCNFFTKYLDETKNESSL